MPFPVVRTVYDDRTCGLVYRISREFRNLFRILALGQFGHHHHGCCTRYASSVQVAAAD